MSIRAWVWIDDGDEAAGDEAAVRVLAERWNELSNAREQRAFDEQARRENGHDECEFDTAEEEAEYVARRHIRDDLEHVELARIEELLTAEGARMARPYEHWNEDEELMEYLERDR